MDARSEERTAFRFRMPEIYNFSTGKIEQSDYWLKQGDEILFRLRYNLQKNRKSYGCPVCKTPVNLSRSTKDNWFFRHLKREEGIQCAIIDEHMPALQKRIQRYNAAKETEEHIFLKSFIADYLEHDPKVVGKPEIEKVVKGQSALTSWKRPDVKCTYGKWDIVFEVQISNTWLSDIVERDTFYTENKTIIIWVFNNFDSCQPNQDTTKADIFYNNPEVNLFVLDELAQEESRKTNHLTFNCYYRIPEINYQSETISDRWDNRLVTIDDLTFDQTSYKPYVVSYHDKKKEASLKLVGWREERTREAKRRKELALKLEREEQLKRQEDERRQAEEALRRKEQRELENRLRIEQAGKEREEQQRLIEAQKIENRCPKEFELMTAKDCVDLIFGTSYKSRNINSIRNRIEDLRDEGFVFPKNAIDIMESRSWIRKMDGSLSLVHYERGQLAYQP